MGVRRVERIEDCASFLLGKAAQAASRRARELLAPHGVTCRSTRC